MHLHTIRFFIFSHQVSAEQHSLSFTPKPIVHNLFLPIFVEIFLSEAREIGRCYCYVDRRDASTWLVENKTTVVAMEQENSCVYVLRDSSCVVVMV